MLYNSLSENISATPYLFSIATLVTNYDEYASMKQSFEGCGFTDNCEYLVADNSKENRFDAYTAINRFIRESKGKYLIIVHQDVRCIDNKNHLLKCLDQLTETDSHWAVCGNAGGIGYQQVIRHLHNAGKIITSANLPAKVFSLDENFLLINQSASLAVSNNIKGFHLYGTDLCIIADFLGYSCYVIAFKVNHLSLGNLSDLKNNTDFFIRLYGEKLRSRFIQTTCTKFYLGNSVFKNKLFNNGFMFFFVKAIQKLKLISNQPLFKKTYKESVEQE